VLSCKELAPDLTLAAAGTGCSSSLAATCQPSDMHALEDLCVVSCCKGSPDFLHSNSGMLVRKLDASQPALP
jgi:hypothetical protein